MASYTQARNKYFCLPVPICIWTLGEYIATGITIKQNDYFFKKIFSLTCSFIHTELEENALQQVSVSDEEITHTDTYLFVCAHGLDENALQQVLCVGVLVCWCVGVSPQNGQ